MVVRQRARRRSAQYAWLITGPLALFAITCAGLFWAADPRWYEYWLEGLVALGGVCLAYVGVFNVVIRRSTYSIIVTEVPATLALYYLPPTMVICAVAGATLISQLLRSTVIMPSKLWFNVAKGAASFSAASLVIAAAPDIRGAGPGTWGILAAALIVSTLVTLLSVAGVMSVVQGPRAGQDVLRGALPPLVISAVNIVVGLVFLVALVATRWSAVLLAVLITALVLMLGRTTSSSGSTARSPTSTSSPGPMTASGPSGGLADVLLGRVRALMQAEYATLWLPAQGRHPEVLLTARVDDTGLLDTVADAGRGPRAGIAQRGRPGRRVRARRRPRSLREALRAASVKDAIVVPLRSGAGGDRHASRWPTGSATSVTFTPGDMPVLETVAAHAAVAVENSRLVDRLRLRRLPRRADRAAQPAADHRTRWTRRSRSARRARWWRVLLFDVDGLRQVNESLGHAAGDKVLAEVADRLRGLRPAGGAGRPGRRRRVRW